MIKYICPIMSGVFPATIQQKTLAGIQNIPTAGGHLVPCQGSNCMAWHDIGKDMGKCGMVKSNSNIKAVIDPIIAMKEAVKEEKNQEQKDQKGPRLDPGFN